jgi:exportin-1
MSTDPFLDQLNAIAITAYGNSLDGQNEAAQALTNAQESEDFWRSCPAILDHPTYVFHLKFIALKGIRDLISSRWPRLDATTRAAIRQYLLETVFSWSQSAEVDPRLLTFLDLVLIEMLKQEWPHENQTLLWDLIASASQSRGLCLNNLQIFYLFSQDVLERGEETMLSMRFREVKTSLSRYAKPVYEFVEHVLSSRNDDEELVFVSLNVLKYFIRWLDARQILQSQMFEGLSRALLPQRKFVNPVLGLFHEIFGTGELSDGFRQAVPEIFSLMIEAITPIMPQTPDAFEELFRSNDELLRILPMTVSVFLDQFGREIEKPDLAEAITSALHWMIALSQVDDSESFKICIDFWHSVALRVNQEKRNPEHTALSVIYGPRLPEIRRIHIVKMVPPTDVLVVDDVREERSTVTQVQYTTMKETLAILTSVDRSDTINAIQELLAGLRQEWDPMVCSRICWSVGGITKTLPPPEEAVFLTAVLSDLFAFCDGPAHGNPEDEATVASGIMYVCAQYPRFLATNEDIFHLVLDRLFAFMHHDHAGVRAMAVQSFQSVVAGSKRTLRESSFIDDILNNFQAITVHLSPPLLVEFYGACAQIVSASLKAEDRLSLIGRLLAPLGNDWQAVAGPVSVDAARGICTILLCYAAVAQEAPDVFRPHLEAIFVPMMDIYSAYAHSIAATVGTSDTFAARRPDVIALKGVKIAVLRLLTKYIARARDITAQADFLLPRIMTDIIEEYGNSPPDARVPDVLGLLEQLCRKMEDTLRTNLPTVFMAVFQQTVAMVSDDFEQHVPFRLPMFSFLQVMIEQYLQVLFTASQEEFDGLIKCLLWGCEHPTPDVCTISLTATRLLFEVALRCETGLANIPAFLAAYYLPVIERIFSVIQDTYHKFAFDEECTLLAALLKIPCDQTAIAEIIHPLFPVIAPDELVDFISKMVVSSTNKVEFKQVVRNFLVAARQFSASELRSLEKQARKEESDKAFSEATPHPNMELLGG